MVRHISWLALALVATLLLASTFAGASQKTSRKEAALRFIAERYASAICQANSRR